MACNCCEPSPARYSGIISAHLRVTVIYTSTILFLAIALYFMEKQMQLDEHVTVFVFWFLYGAALPSVLANFVATVYVIQKSRMIKSEIEKKNLKKELKDKQLERIYNSPICRTRHLTKPEELVSPVDSSGSVERFQVSKEVEEEFRSLGSALDDVLMVTITMRDKITHYLECLQKVTENGETFYIRQQVLKELDDKEFKSFSCQSSPSKKRSELDTAIDNVPEATKEEKEKSEAKEEEQAITESNEVKTEENEVADTPKIETEALTENKTPIPPVGNGEQKEHSEAEKLEATLQKDMIA